MIKHYISLNSLQLSTTITLEGKEHSVTFKGGKLKPSRRNGTFSTSDTAIQEAIENDSGYGQKFTLIDFCKESDVKKKRPTSKNNQCKEQKSCNKLD